MQVLYVIMMKMKSEVLMNAEVEEAAVVYELLVWVPSASGGTARQYKAPHPSLEATKTMGNL